MTPQVERWARDGEALLGSAGLPTGSLTVVELDSATPMGFDHWWTVLPPLVGLLRTAGPVHITDCWPDSCNNGPALRSRAADDEIFFFSDEDVTVRGPFGLYDTPVNTTVTQQPLYDCNLPTLSAVRMDLRRVEEHFGPAAVVVDFMEMARPYLLAHAFDEEEARRPPASWGLDGDVIDGWRASDFADFAEARTTPTVVVWHEPGDNPPAVEALRAVSCLWIASKESRSEDTVEILVRRRGSVADRWSSSASFTWLLQGSDGLGPRVGRDEA